MSPLRACRTPISDAELRLLTSKQVWRVSWCEDERAAQVRRPPALASSCSFPCAAWHACSGSAVGGGRLAAQQAERGMKRNMRSMQLHPLPPSQVLADPRFVELSSGTLTDLQNIPLTTGALCLGSRPLCCTHTRGCFQGARAAPPPGSRPVHAHLPARPPPAPLPARLHPFLASIP